jgi:hypothetical protein
MQQLNGKWKLDKSSCSNLRELLVKMGRNQYQCSCVESADEEFELFISKDQDNIPVLQKKVRIWINETLMQWYAPLLAVLGSNDPRSVKYDNTFRADKTKRDHPDDEKRFGPCQTACFADDNRFVIKWFMQVNGKPAIMTSDHYTENGNLVVKVTFEVNGDKVESIKKYVRDTSK